MDIECLACISDGNETDGKPVMVKTRIIGEKNNGILYKGEYNRHWGMIETNFNDPFNWETKTDDIVWRGVHSTGWWKKANRRLCVSQNFQKYNIGFSNEETYGNYYQENMQLFKGNMTIPEMLRYKYLLCIEGNDVATGLKWMMASNSLVIMPKPTTESWLMEGLLQPFVHYVPLEDDFSDLDAKLDWCKRNDSKCKEISMNATIWMKQFLDKENELRLHNEIKKWYQNNVRFIT